MTSENRATVLQEWSTPDGSHLAGQVYGHPSYPDGTAVTTSPIVLVRLTGAERKPVAYTRSGSIYCLGEPSESFGQAKAEAFVIEKLGEEGVQPSDGDSMMRTTVLRIREPSVTDD
jgi:hypothetical protein